LTDLQKREAERWVDFYEYHDKYTFVGVLREDPVETAVERAWAMEEAIKVRAAAAPYLVYPSQVRSTVYRRT
jgi:hypothetical protein